MHAEPGPLPIPATDSLPCEACSLDPQRCTYCRLPYAGKAECRVRAAQRAAIEEIAVQRAEALNQHIVREKELLRQYRNTLVDSQRKTGDEMRGGLHALESKGFVAAQQLRAPGKQFSRSEVIAILRSCRADAGSVADAEYARLINIFERME